MVAIRFRGRNGWINIVYTKNNDGTRFQAGDLISHHKPPFHIMEPLLTSSAEIKITRWKNANQTRSGRRVQGKQMRTHPLHVNSTKEETIP